VHDSFAVLQPLLFEGWSTSLEESKAMCKQIVLSKIDTHLEQAPERGLFFSPDSPDELAACLKSLHTDFSPAVEQSFVEQRPHHKTRIERDWIEEFARIMKTLSGSRG
jgi:glycosyltransferase involved in cell wall biosynthesis